MRFICVRLLDARLSSGRPTLLLLSALIRCRLLFHVCARRLVLRVFSDHSLRAIAETRLFDKDIDEQLIMLKTGHKTVSDGKLSDLSDNVSCKPAEKVSKSLPVTPDVGIITIVEEICKLLLKCLCPVRHLERSNKRFNVYGINFSIFKKYVWVSLDIIAWIFLVFADD